MGNSIFNTCVYFDFNNEPSRFLDMWKIPVAVTIIFLLMPLAASESSLDSMIAESCPDDYEPVISMAAPDKTYSHPGPPDFFQYNLCVQGITETRIAHECTGNEGFYLHSNNTDYAHFSMHSTYNIPVCTDQMVTQVRDSCQQNQTSLFSVSSEHNAHVASPGVFDNEVCGFFQPPENVTLSMEFNLTSSDDVYFDEQTVDEGEQYLAEFPYIVSEGDNHVAGIVADDMIKVERRVGQENRISMERDTGEFLVPFTHGDHLNVERRQELILENEFMEQLLPSFGFFMPEQARIKTALDTEVIIDSGIELDRGSHTIEITKTGENQVTIEQK